MQITTEKAPESTTFQAKYCLKTGKSIPDTNERLQRIGIARAMKSYYEEMNIQPEPSKGSYKMGFGPATALYEIGVATALMVKSFSPATLINFVTSFGEFAETVIGGTSILLSDKERELKSKMESTTNLEEKELLRNELEDLSEKEGESKWDWNGHGSAQKAEMAMSGIQFSAGILGAIQMAWGKYFNRESADKEIPFVQKTLLSAGSLLSAGLMFFSSGEKSLISTFCENRSNKEIKPHPTFKESGQMWKNAVSDARCFWEWIGMAVFPWVKEVKLTNWLSAKDVFDGAITALALKEGVNYFAKKDSYSNDLMSYLFKPDFAKELYLGTEEKPGLRNKLLLPILRFFGCKSAPLAFISGNEVVCRVGEDLSGSNSLFSGQDAKKDKPTVERQAPPRKLASVQ